MQFISLTPKVIITSLYSSFFKNYYYIENSHIKLFIIINIIKFQKILKFFTTISKKQLNLKNVVLLKNNFWYENFDFESYI